MSPASETAAADEGPAAGPPWAPPDLALVLFSGRASLPWLRLLKPGFRHCFVLLRTGKMWLYYDPMTHYTFASVIGRYPLLALLRVFRDHGYRWRLARPRVPPPRAQAWRPYTCVEAVKRVLGISAPWVLTPWQLYCRLTESRRNLLCWHIAMSGTRDPVDTDFAGDDAAVIHAAARHLRVSEYDLFKLAYDKWWGRAPADKELEPVFVSFLYHHDTPHWARHFARDVLRRARDGTLDRDAMGAGEYRRVVPFVPRRHGPAKATVALVAAYVALASLIYYKTEIGHALCRALDRDGVMGGVASVLVARDSEFCRQARRRKPADEPISEEAARR